MIYNLLLTEEENDAVVKLTVKTRKNELKSGRGLEETAKIC